MANTFLWAYVTIGILECFETCIMYFKILDSVSSVEKKVNLAISEEINKRIRKNLVKLKPEVQSFIGDSIINQPEMVSLVGGYLRGLSV